MNSKSQADLTNFINDGALPGYQFGKTALENANYRVHIMDMGMAIMKAETIEIQGETLRQYNQEKHEQQTLTEGQQRAQSVQNDR